MARAASFYADHILEAIANIEADIAGHDFESFLADQRTLQLAVWESRGHSRRTAKAAPRQIQDRNREWKNRGEVYAP